MEKRLVIYGSGWCPATRTTARRLEIWRIPFRYVDVDESPEDERRIAEWNHGRAVRPTVDIDGDILVDPSPSRLETALREHGYLAPK